MPTGRPSNAQGQAPSRGARQSVERLREKESAMRGKANKSRAKAEAAKVSDRSRARPSTRPR